ncbi:pyrroline-5-carboxylate reductase [Leptospira sp. GIMC2001]|uniref:pyrroline-5-carboxylate reductase n=1 Tax=Leptospira sp. GIMC2001 TaxID=1513297 RepID=UPI00234B174D|nr:pyrroline-5-carboxylate reductase [Leptospira sp. GIMC2001]WCL48151.1 pyrroline-5-carboxylate reductase [Leptospira sp. GIMC2001]
MDKMRIGFIGLGNMGYAIYNGIGDDYIKLAYDPIPKYIEEIEYSESVREIADKSEILIICVKPHQVEKVIREIESPRTIISIAAGIDYKSLVSWADPESRVIRTMPNLPLQSKTGVIAYFGNTEEYSIIELLFSKLGKTVALEKEELMDAVTGLSGSGPAFVFSFLQAMAEGGVKSGLAYSESLSIAIETIAGSMSYLKSELEKDGSIHPMELRNRVTSPGGTTIYGISEWEKNKVSYGIAESVFQASKRSKELGKN